MSELQKKLGNLLKTERERQDISLEDIAEKLKIAEANLSAIEEGDISMLPSEIYFSLFSKTYAEALGFDYTAIIDELQGTIAEAEDVNKKSSSKKKADSTTEDEIPEKGAQNNLTKTAGYAFGGIVIVFILFLLINTFFLKSDEGQSEAEISNGIENEVINKKSDSEMAAMYADYDWESVVYEKPEKLILTLVSSEQCWSAVFADGDTALYQNLRPNRVYQIEADYRILVSVGMPSKVTIKLNGQDVDLRDPNSRRIYKVLINQLNHKEFLNPQVSEASTSNSTSSVTGKNASLDSLAAKEIPVNVSEPNESES